MSSLLGVVSRNAVKIGIPASAASYSSLVGLFTSRTIMAVGMVTSSAVPIITFCESKKNDVTNKKDDSFSLVRDAQGNVDWLTTLSRVTDTTALSAGTQLQAAIDTGIPTSFSYGFITGYCSGLALKKVGRTVAVIFGLGFVSLQTLAHYGYIHVDHGQIKKKVEELMDLNQDGVVDMRDAALAQEKILNILQVNLPGGGGFVAGFLGGFRSG